ncbi:glutathione S-transferase family protein [Roseibium marinum]|uniref:Glutathione S-transferase n=1 Tax=Roseibium marinum TaxID=281252 RepID=A0A2S3UTF2_9HYPH|nr:glutathione S-transferase family protein [Roseibium marinum]POF30840.1 glutathione S-transferase [Roseibium marinum]
MSNPVLYNYDLDENCYKVRLLLSCLGIEAETIAVDVFPGNEHLSPAIRAMSPKGSLPVLKQGDLVLHEAEAILAWLARSQKPDKGFLPNDPDTFAHVMMWLAFSARELDVAVRARVTAMMDAPGDIDALRSGAREALRIMEDHMTRQHFDDVEYVAGARATIADIALFPSFALSRDYNIDHDAFPALRRWARAVRRIDGFITMPGIPDYH